MRSRSNPALMSILDRPVRHRIGAAGRRIAVVLVASLLLGVVAPAGSLPPDHGHTSVSWLWNWLSARPTWAYGEPAVPKQQAGKPVTGHYADVPRAKDTGRTRPAKGELARYQQHRPAERVRTTGAAVRGFDRRTSEPVPSGATAKSDVFENADGSYTRRVYTEPVNYRAADGAWRDIDNTLKPDADRARVTANGFDLRPHLVWGCCSPTSFVVRA
jgi:hypothetical protein